MGTMHVMGPTPVLRVNLVLSVPWLGCHTQNDAHRVPTLLCQGPVPAHIVPVETIVTQPQRYSAMKGFTALQMLLPVCSVQEGLPAQVDHYRWSVPMAPTLTTEVMSVIPVMLDSTAH